MAAPATLIETLAHLQQQRVSTAYARHLLLDYARQCAHASLGLLFRLDRLTQQLVLVEQCGQPPIYNLSLAHTRIPLNGLFGTVLHRAGLLRVSDPTRDPHSLSLERGWIWQGSHLQLCAAGGGLSKPGAQGVMVLCGEPETQHTAETNETTQADNEILICAALLGA